MKKNILGASMLAMIGGISAAAFAASDAISNLEYSPLPVRRPSARTYHHRGADYPEQSSRQAMRAHRRQQGGNGIALNSRTHQYEEVSVIDIDSWF